MVQFWNKKPQRTYITQEEEKASGYKMRKGDMDIFSDTCNTFSLTISLTKTKVQYMKNQIYLLMYSD